MTGRPKATAPRGRVTLAAAAAELTGVSRSAVYRRIESGELPSLMVGGVVTIARRDLKRIEPREPAAGDGRRAVMLRPDLERYASWERAAGDRPVSSWIAELADRAAGL